MLGRTKKKPTNDLQSAKRAVMDCLNRGMYTVHELTQKLIHKGFSPELAAEACRYYEEIGYLNDQMYAVCYIRDAINIKGHGYRRIVADLERRGVPRALFDELYPTLDPDPVERILGLMRLRPRPADRKEAQKFYGYFMRRGFSPSQITEALRRVGIYIG